MVQVEFDDIFSSKIFVETVVRVGSDKEPSF